jgi:penicillin-binding protein 1C
MFGSAVPMNLPFKVALKTGTTKAYTDLWALGTTRETTVGIWTGNFDGEPTHRVHSIDGATPLMRAIYTAIAARYGYPSLPDRPSGLVERDICSVSGKYPGPNCTQTKRELFLPDHFPTGPCDVHASKSTPTQTSTALRIIEPNDGAKFLLEPYRPARLQRPNLAALPSNEKVDWTIDGAPAHVWIPTPGTHRVRATSKSGEDEVTISYEL